MCTSSHGSCRKNSAVIWSTHIIAAPPAVLASADSSMVEVEPTDTRGGGSEGHVSHPKTSTKSRAHSGCTATSCCAGNIRTDFLFCPSKGNRYYGIHTGVCLAKNVLLSNVQSGRHVRAESCHVTCNITVTHQRLHSAAGVIVMREVLHI